MGAGTGSTALFGETLYGDYNVDLGGRRDVPHGTPGAVTWANAEDLSDFPTGSMGAVMASHLLEHVHADRAEQHLALGVHRRGAAVDVETALPP